MRWRYSTKFIDDIYIQNKSDFTRELQFTSENDEIMCSLASDEFPPELCVPMLTFVALTGLDVVHNAVHKAIWSLLTTNRPSDRVPIQFQLMDGDHEYPKPKPKRQSYEWYVPKGLLRVNWMSKHLYHIPSLVVVFFDLDWDAVGWNEKLMELCAKVQVARTALEGRNTKVAIVLIQQTSPLPPGDDVVASERATALCSACDLPAKLLFVFPHTDHQFGYAIRLENAFYELAQTYYQQQAKQVKGHREFLNKTTHQLLFVRHQFKMGFYNELRHDVPLALKHYKQAYANLMEVRTTDTNVNEVKMVAGFISYKICKLSFYRNIPLEAIAQFRKHVDIFKSRVGHPELSFEHSAWMSKQFSAFGDLFEEAIKVGLSAIQTQHPGFYYQQAAVHATSRKRLCAELCRDSRFSRRDPLVAVEKIEHYGHRPWRPGVQSLELPDHQLEQNGIVALQGKEANDVNHSMLIIPLLSNAIAQFKKYRCPRMKRYLVVQMGEEYFDAGDYSKSLTLLSHVIWDYRSERWWSLLTGIVRMAIKCAYATGSVQDYVTLCLEMTSKHIEVSHLEKERVQRNLVAATSNLVPFPEPDLDAINVENAEELWRASPNSEPLAVTVEMNPLSGFLTCSPSFAGASCFVDSSVLLSVLVEVYCPLPIRFTKLSVMFSNPVYNESCIVTDANTVVHNGNGCREDLLFEPNIAKNFDFSFVAYPADVNQIVNITSVVLQLGSEYERCAVLRWKYVADDCLGISTPVPHEEDGELKGAKHLGVRILPRHCRLAIRVDHDAPALLNELYPLRIVFENRENRDIEQFFLDVVIPNPPSNASLFVADLTEKRSSIRRLSLGRISSGQTLEKEVFVRVSSEGSCTVLVKVEYDLLLQVNGNDLSFACCAEEEIMIPVIQPFNVTTKTLSPKMKFLDEVWVQESVLLQVEIESTSPWPLVFSSSRFKLNMDDSEQFSSQVEGVVLNSGDVASECHSVVVPVVDDPRLHFGVYYVSWRRSSSSEMIPSVETAMALPTVSTVKQPVGLTIDLPAHGWVRTPLTVVYHVTNRLSQVQEFDFCMESSDSFMFAGHKQAHFKILPLGKLALRYNLYPLVPGCVSLPKLKLVTHDASYDSHIDQLVQMTVPSQIFIMPQAKQFWNDSS